ncbi:MAG: histidinol-phosphatase HisJ family protein [Desulfitobacterium hafniense]|nr:histidinol-phosphatase HisJ family protein [Desulfitobacterium hafniense]
MIDLHVHLIGHQDRAATSDNLREFLNTASERGLKEIGFADHDHFFEELNFPLIKEVAAEYPELKVRVGLEVDYRPQEEDKIRERLTKFPFDYVIGSVHEIEGWMFDHPDAEALHSDYDPDELYRSYFKLVEQAARSRLFTTIGHLDLVKIFGVRPNSDVIKLAEKAIQEINNNGLAVEINTNGRYKPIREFYPEMRLVEVLAAQNVPITLGSDAHQADVVGRDLTEVISNLKGIGVKELVSFEKLQTIKYML